MPIRTPSLLENCGLTRHFKSTSVSTLARQFTASNNEHFTIGSSSGVNLGTADFSLECWFNRDSISGSELWASKFGDGNNFWAMGTSASSLPHYQATIGGSLVHSIAATTAIITPGWHHLIIVADRDTVGNCKAYLDGSDDTAGGALMTTGNLDNSGTFYLGQKGDGSLDWNGGACRFRIYKALLTADDVTNLYNSGVGRLHRSLPSGLSPSASYDLNEVAGNAIAQVGNNGGDQGTVTSRAGPS